MAVCLLAVLCFRPAPSWAQRGDSGAITGYVFDQAGNPLSGVKLTAESPTQIGGRKVTYSTAEGAFRFPVLQPGTFQVRAEAPRLQTVVQDNIRVGLNSAAEMNVIMEVASTKVEEVRVVEKAPLVSTSTANVKEVFDVDFVANMPHDNRDVVFQQITNYAAGAIKGGRVRGGAGNQTILMMDGFNMLRQYPTMKAAAAYEIQTGAYGAENATAPGGVVNLATKSGSNRFELELNATADHSALQFFPRDFDPDARSFFYVVNPTVSGPIIKDRLWYSANVEFLTRTTGREKDAAGILPDPLPEHRYWHKGTVKLTWQVSARNKLQSVTNFDEFWMKNREPLGTADDAQRNFQSRNYFSGLIWESLLTDNLILRSQVGVSNTERHGWPQSCETDPGHCDFIPSQLQTFPSRLVYGNANLHDRTRTYSFQAVNRLELFAQGRAVGEHHFQLQDFFMTQGDVNGRSVPGDTVFEWNGPNVPEARIDYYSNDPRLEPERRGWFFTTASATRNTVSLSDRYRPTRHLTITPGIAFVTARAENSQGAPVFDNQAFTPNLSLAWDATHDGRTALRASFAHYVDSEVIAIASHTLGTQVQRRCRYNTATGNYDRECTYSGGAAGATVGFRCSPTGVDEQGRRCASELVLPRTREYTAGAEREIVQGLSLGLEGIYRQYSHQFERFETNRIWNGAGSALVPTGQFRNGRNQTVSDLETPADARRRYVGVTASATRREGRFKLNGSYTWSRLDGTVMDGNNNLYGDRGPRDLFLDGPLPDDHRHEVKANLSYAATRWLSATVRYSYYSGLPYSRRFRNSVTNSYDDLRARVGTNPGNNLNDPADDRGLRMPDIQSLNAQVAFNFLPLIGHQLETYVDVLNVLGLRTPNAVEESAGPLFGTPRGWEGPLRIRLGMRYRY
jgi:hypothetical protein